MISYIKRSFFILCTALAGIVVFPSIEATSSWTGVVQSLSAEEKRALDSFFRVLLQDSQGGYVLYGNKPICIEGVLEFSGNVLMIEGDLHRRSVILKEGYRIWNNLLLTKQPQSYQISMKEIPNSSGWIELLLINREAFFKVVQENLLLFQYVLGPKVTASSLWDKLMDPNETFSSIFRNDRVLIGIVLGFGTENALYGSRNELINEYLYKEQQLPFSPITTRIQSKYKTTDEGSIYNNLNGEPSFGYQSLKEEKEDLDKKLLISKEIVKKSSPMIPWFGCVKNQETQKLLKDYTDTQKNILTVLETDQFLEQIFTKIFGEQPISIIHRQNDFSSDTNFSTLIGQELWQELLEQNDLWVDAFIDGMQASEQPSTKLMSEDAFDQLLIKLQDSQKALKAKQNLRIAEQFFSSLEKRKDLVRMITGELYYHSIKEGSGKKISGLNAQIIMHCSVTNASGDILYATRENNLVLSELIPGIALGMKGMKTGEVREIFIHPAWAYGKENHTDPNMMLIAKIEVTEILTEGIDDNTRQPLKLLLTNLTEAELKQMTEELNQKIAFQLGVKIWRYFKENKSYSLEEVITSLRKAQKGEIINLSSHENQNALNRLHWSLMDSAKNCK